jgi:hypothetical protein
MSFIASRFAQRAAHAVDDRCDEQQRDRRHRPRGGLGQRREPRPQRERAEHERAVALAHRAVVAARRAGERPHRARVLGDGREHDHRGGPRRRERREPRERRDERRVGDDIAELVEERAEAASLAVLAREHAVERVERHAQREPRRHQQERARAWQRRPRRTRRARPTAPRRRR